MVMVNISTQYPLLIVTLNLNPHPAPPQPFIALEYLDLKDALNTVVRLPDSEKLRVAKRIIEKVASALAYLHDKGLVHGDVKGGNVLTDTTGNIVKLIDFAFVRPEGKRLSKTEEGFTNGTLAYMSVSRIIGEPPTKADDIYALGITLAEILIYKVRSSRWKKVSELRKKQPYYTGVDFVNLHKETVAMINASSLPPSYKKLLLRMVVEPVEMIKKSIAQLQSNKETLLRMIGEEETPFQDCHELLRALEDIERLAA
jgi:serine/threonine protein kinase